MGELTIAQILGSVWVQGGLVAAALASIGFDKSDALKAIAAKISAWWTSRRAGKTSPAVSGDCESRRLTLVGIRHKASEHPDVAKRTEYLALCDRVDAAVKELWPEAA